MVLGEAPPTRVTERAMETRKRGDNVGSTVGMKFSKPTITQTLGGEEPMVCLDATALTQRIGSISPREAWLSCEAKERTSEWQTSASGVGTQGLSY